MALPPTPPPPPAQWPLAFAPTHPRPWLTFMSAATALIALGVAIGAWLRPLPDNKPPAAPTYTDQQVADAKTNVCAAFEKVDHALDLSAARNGGDDPTAILAVATSGRQVLEAGSRYLSMKLGEEPATPRDLTDAVQKLANLWQELTIGYLDGLTNSDPDLQPALRTGDEITLTIRRICK